VSARPQPGRWPRVCSSVTAARISARRVAAVLVACGALGAVALPGSAWLARASARSQQFIAAGDIGADLAVGDDGRAFLVTLGARRDPGRSVAVRVRSAAAGAGFGPALRVRRFGARRRDVQAGIAADGSGVIAVRAVRRTHRRVEVVSFDARGRVSRAVTVSRGDAADLATLDVAPSGAVLVVWFRHGQGRRWRLEAATRESGSAAFGPATPVSGFVRRPCCTSLSAAIGDRGDAVVTWTSTSRPVVSAAMRGPGRGFRRPQMLTANAADAPRAAVGAGGTAAVLYSVQHVPPRPRDGLQLHRAVRSGPFGPPEQVNPGGGVTIGEATVTPGGRVLVAWIDRARASVHVSEAAPGGPLFDAGELGTDVAPARVAVAADDDGAAAVAWTQLVSLQPVPRERAVAALRPGGGAPFGRAIALGQPWRAASPETARLLPHGGALAVWRGDRFTGPARRRTALAVTRLP